MSHNQNHDSDMDDFIHVTPEDAIPHLSNTELNHPKSLYDTDTCNAYVMLHVRSVELQTETVATAIEAILAALDTNTQSMKRLTEEMLVKKEIMAGLEEEIEMLAKQLKELMRELENRQGREDAKGKRKCEQETMRSIRSD
jgi:hypothetical protein